MKNLIQLYCLLFLLPIFSQNSKSITGGLVFDNGKIKVYSKKSINAFYNAKLELKTPKRHIKQGKNIFTYLVTDYNLKKQTTGQAREILANSSKGQHIHFIVDNKPYQAKYEPHFEADLEQGSHLVLAFLSRSFHESIKTKDAYVLKQYHFGKNKLSVNVKKDPFLFYSRPKGTYSIEKKNKVLLDFYLVNTTLSKEGNKVRVTINETSFEVTKWQPYIIEGLSTGNHEIQIELIDSKGEVVQGLFNNSGIRTFTIK